MNLAALEAPFWLMCAGYAFAAAGVLGPSPKAARAMSAAGTVAGALAGLWLAGRVLGGGPMLVIDAPAVLGVDAPLIREHCLRT